jgi:RimJ/RimL family protein N-acetyltransferase
MVLLRKSIPQNHNLKTAAELGVMRTRMIELREFVKGDEALLVSYLNEPTITKFMSARIPQPYTNESASWWVNTGSKIGINYAILKDNVFVGSIGAIPGEFEKQRSAEVGYWLAKSYWGNGITSEALQRFTNIIFETTDIIRLYASVFEGNISSSKVLEKCGFKLEAIFEKAIFKNEVYFNELHYGKVRS